MFGWVLGGAWRTQRACCLRRVWGLCAWFVLWVAWWGIGVAAASEKRGQWGHSELGEAVWYAHPQEMDRALRGRMTPVIVDAKGFSRVGVRWDAHPSLEWEARFRSQGKTWGVWLPLSVTWRASLDVDTSTFNGHIDVPDGRATEVQLRLLGSVWPRFVAVEAIDRVGPAAPHSQQSSPISLLPNQALTGPFNARSVWGAAAAKCTTSNPTKNRIAVHHTVTPNNETGSTIVTRLRGIQSFHQNTRGWCDIGYHLLVSWDGQAWEGTPAELLGTHVGGQNTGTLGISFLGDFTSTEPPSVMTCTGSKLMDWGVKTFGVPRTRTSIMGHREFPSQSTGCPGDRLLAQVTNMIQMSSSGTCTAPPPPKCDYVQTNTASLNIRPQSNTNQPPIGTIPQNTCLKVLNKTTTGQSVSGNTTWYEISYNNVTGWISAYYAPCTDCGPAPTPEGTLQGFVYDDANSDKSLRLEAVTLKLNNGQTAQTNAKGEFRFTLKTGVYTINASKSGFQTATAQATVEDAKTANVEIAMKKAATPDNKPPIVILSAPKDGASLPEGDIDVSGKATDDVKVDRVEVNGTPATLNADGTFSATLSLIAGVHTITAAAFDAAGNKGEAKISITLTSTQEPVAEDSPEPSAEAATPEEAAPTDASEDNREDRLVLESLPETAQVDKGQSDTPCKLNSECPNGQLCQNGRCTTINGASGGCNCQSSTPTAPSLAVFLLLLLALCVRRRHPSAR
ncbi:N-acetylmuramoyl-L-alanine amidase [Myxococcota bacterium]|nr:N-acetylmuramoyl-L-alanine amidase [Myxococcota bacterium]